MRQQMEKHSPSFVEIGLNIARAAGVPGVVGLSGFDGVSPACNLKAVEEETCSM